MIKHTPGPWRVEHFSPGQEGDFHVIRQRRSDGGFDDYIASTWGGPRAADARLIAGAPNMRDALFRICDAESLREAKDIADEALASMGDDS